MFEGLQIEDIPVIGVVADRSAGKWVEKYWLPAAKLADTKADVQVFRYQDVKLAFEYAKGHSNNWNSGWQEENCWNTFIIAGFSFGGDSAIQLANLLKESKFVVEAGVTADPRWQNDSAFGTSGDKGQKPFTKPTNALVWKNRYQHSGQYNGNPVTGSEQGEPLTENSYRDYVKPARKVENPSDNLTKAFQSSHVSGYTVHAMSQLLADVIKQSESERKY